MNRQSLSDFVAWTQAHITGDEKGQAHIFLDRLFQACGQPGCLDVGGTPEFRVCDFETQMDAPVDTLALTELP